MSRVVHFEISIKDPAKAIDFYRNVFGWEINKWEGPTDYWLIRTGDPSSPGIDGAMFQPGELFSGTVNTIGVADFDATAAKVLQNGGQVVTKKDLIPGIGYFAYCKDAEGSLFGILEPVMEPGQ